MNDMKEAFREMFERDWKNCFPNDADRGIRFAMYEDDQYVMQETQSAYTMWKAGYVSRMRAVPLGNTRGVHIPASEYES